jgi:hypothetical protein
MTALTNLRRSSGFCNPRWSTPRSRDRQTLGPEILTIGRQLGHTLMPWQQLVADTGLEIDRDSGLPAFREVVVTVPRQSGKTTLVLAWELQRALMWNSMQRCAYTAQTGWDARRKLIDDQAPILMGSPLKATVTRVFRGSGTRSRQGMGAPSTSELLTRHFPIPMTGANKRCCRRWPRVRRPKF